MFANYFKLAIKVLGRNRFFTFISLFGISFTLMILMLITAFLDTELGAYEPMSEREKMVFLGQVEMRKMVTDTILQIDTTMLNGVEVYDSTYDYNKNNTSTSISSGGFPFYDEYLRNIEGTATETFFSTNASFDVFVNNNKLIIRGVYADAAFFDVLDFTFIEGNAFNQQAVDNQALSIVISKKVAKSYFGKETGIVGKAMELEGKHYKVVGVVRTMDGPAEMKADVIIPYTNMSAYNLKNRNSFQGPFQAIFLAKSKEDRAVIQSEIAKKSNLIPMPEPENYNVLELSAATFREQYAHALLYKDTPQKSLKMAYGVLSALLLLFILLPTLNLINLNISRIMERSSEIGVRKAFGAHSGNILVQFVFENIILTFIGGIIGFLLALLLLNTVNESHVFGDTVLAFNGKVFLYSVLICLAFGILSGIIPAYRMSKIHIIKALKG